MKARTARLKLSKRALSYEGDRYYAYRKVVFIFPLGTFNSLIDVDRVDPFFRFLSTILSHLEFDPQ